jgi:hypothetical protein
MFLVEEVFDRGLRTSQHTKKRKANDGTEIIQTLGAKSIESYCNAILSLYKYQVSIGRNAYPNARGVKLKALLENRIRQEHKRKRTQYVDRGANTLQDYHHETDNINFVRSCWTNLPGNRPQLSIDAQLRTAVDFTHSYNMILRGEARRTLQLPDLFSVPLSYEGPTPCHAMIMIMDNGKTNQFNRLEYSAAVRHKNVLRCALSQTAFYLFWRWNCTGEEPPRFQQRQQWYDIFLLKGADRTKPLSYPVQLQWVNQIFKAAGIRTRKKTHYGREEGAIKNELDGVAENQLRRAGHWNSDALSSCYLTNLPLEFVRSSAGFAPRAQGDYYLPRAKITPPSSLVNALWPWIDQWQAWFNRNLGKPDSINTSYGDPPLIPLLPEEEDRTDLAAQGFLKLLAELRIIILQDSVLLRTEFPQHPLWRDPIFLREDYLRFAHDVELSVRDIEEPDELRLRRVIPDVLNRMNISHQDIVRSMDRNHNLSEAIFHRLEDLFAGRVTISLHGPPATFEAETRLRTIAESAASPLISQEATSNNSTDTQQPLHGSDCSLEQNLVKFDPALPPPSYVMSRTISRVPDLWREWSVGLGSGPAVKKLEQTYGARWRIT